MSHVLIDLMAVWMFSAGTPAEMEYLPREEAVQTSGTIVIDRFDENTVSIETKSGMLDLPREVIPIDDLHEGMVIEWRVSEEEEALRREEAQARIERLRETVIVKK